MNMNFLDHPDKVVQSGFTRLGDTGIGNNVLSIPHVGQVLDHQFCHIVYQDFAVRHLQVCLLVPVHVALELT